MMGLRGCRLGIVHPSVSRMQVAAVFQAAAKVAAQGMVVKPAIMVPLVGVAEVRLKVMSTHV